MRSLEERVGALSGEAREELKERLAHPRYLAVCCLEIVASGDDAEALMNSMRGGDGDFVIWEGPRFVCAMVRPR
jgi:hypothetical protein